MQTEYAEPSPPVAPSRPEPLPADASQIRPTSPWIGFAYLEDWARAIDPSRPVLVLPLAEPRSAGGALSTDDLLVVCQQVTVEGGVFYCRLRAASLTRCYGTPFDPDWREREAAWNSLAVAVEEYLRGRGLTLRRATVAYPKGLVLLQGESSPIAFDASTRRYALRSGTDAASS